MLKIRHKNSFKKDVKLCQKRNLDLTKLKEVIVLLSDGDSLPAKYKDHYLSGNYSGHRECHIQPDWLLIYKIVDDTIIFERTGSHSDLFK